MIQHMPVLWVYLMEKVMQKIILIDGHSILNRAFFGMPDLTNQKGEHVGAISGFLNIFLKQYTDETPDAVAVAFDLSAPTFRHEKYKEYKGTRKPMDPALKAQVPVMRELLKNMGVRVVEMEGYEADDVLGTLAKQAEADGFSVIILSGDKDLFQLASDNICIRIPRTKKGETTIEDFYAEDVKRTYQVTPVEFIDVKALMGDTSDNIPGVLGIGEKNAIKIISEYHSIEEAIKHVDDGKPTKVMTNFKEQYESAVFSKWLATIKTDVPLGIKTDELLCPPVYTNEAVDMLKLLGLKKLSEKFAGNIKNTGFGVEKSPTPGTASEAENASESETSSEKTAYIKSFISGEDEIGAYIDGLKGDLAFYLTAEDAALGLSVCDLEKKGEEGYEIVSFDADSAILKRFSERLLINEGNYYTFDLKKQLRFLFGDNTLGAGLLPEKRRAFCDLTVAAYLVNPLLGDYPYTDIAAVYAGLTLSDKKTLLGKMSMTEAAASFGPLRDSYQELLGAPVEAAVSVYSDLMKKLSEYGMSELFYNIEMPLVFVLCDMEAAGIYTDREELETYSRGLGEDIKALEDEIYELAGEEFNINSPKQLGEILFEKLSLPHGKKTKTGYSTAVDVLESLAFDYPIVSKILKYRALSKLKSTYADGLREFIAEDDRIHTSFNQTITATGRLSSTDPNLQNIPIRTEQGRLIRKVFRSVPGNIFIDSDYSQVELRILAHMSGDENLIKAYNESADIHRMTAARVFGVEPSEVTDIQRRNAKAVNFGIVYGISTFGLSEDLSISRAQAKEYIDSYFESFPGVKAYLDRCVRLAKENGYITTLFGRRRPIPELSSSNFNTRSFGERVAMNSPIQGTAADIMKIAMIRIHDRLFEEKIPARMLIQVHDEVLIEAGEEACETVERLVETEMKAAAELSVELSVDVHRGHTWYEAK